MFNLQIDIRGDREVFVSDCQIAAADRRPTADASLRDVKTNGLFFGFDVDELEPVELLLLAAGLRRSARAAAVLFDESLQLLLFGQGRGVDAPIVLAAFVLVFDVLLDIGGKERQFSRESSSV